MRATRAVAGLLALSVIADCERQPGPPVPLESFALHDVQGLWGGHEIWAAGDRTAFVHVVGPPRHCRCSGPGT
jgi:hypothetical protein